MQPDTMDSGYAIKWISFVLTNQSMLQIQSFLIDRGKVRRWVANTASGHNLPSCASNTLEKQSQWTSTPYHKSWQTFTILHPTLPYYCYSVVPQHLCCLFMALQGQPSAQADICSYLWILCHCVSKNSIIKHLYEN